MAQAAVRADLDETLDVERDLAPQVAFDLVAAVDQLAQPVDLLLGEVPHPGVRVDVRLGQDLLAGRQTDPEDVGERDLDALLARNVDAGDTGHRLPLPLLVLRVGADDHHGAVATNDLAVVAARLDGSSDFQRILDLLEAVGDPATGQVVRRQLDADPVTGQDADEVHPELAADMGEHPVAVLQLDREHGVGQRFDDRTLYLDRVALGHRSSCFPFSWAVSVRADRHTNA